LAKDKEASSIRVFVQDESRFGLLPIIRRRITIKGVKPIQKVQHEFDNYYVYGAVEPISGESFFLELSHLNSVCFQIFLDEFHDSYPDDFIIMPLDNGTFHKAKKLVIPDNIMLLFITPYSPELNPIERLWQDIKDEISCSLYETLDELKEAVAEVLRKYSHQDIASLTGYQYLVDAINAL
jgi:transposase